MKCFMHKLLVCFAIIVTCSATSTNELKQLLQQGANRFYSFPQLERQHFVDKFSQLLIDEISKKAKSVSLEDEYQIFRYAQRLTGSIKLHEGISSKPMLRFKNATIVNYNEEANRLEMKTRLAFQPIRLSYTQCKLQMMGTTENGTLSARIDNFEGDFATVVEFKAIPNKSNSLLLSLSQHLKRTRPVLSDEHSTTYPIVDLVLKETDVNSTMFERYANMVNDRNNLEQPFRRQMRYVFETLVLDNVASVYAAL